MNHVAKTIAYIVAAIIGLAALITSLLYDWSNKEPGETSSERVSAKLRDY